MYESKKEADALCWSLYRKRIMWASGENQAPEAGVWELGRDCTADGLGAQESSSLLLALRPSLPQHSLEGKGKTAAARELLLICVFCLCSYGMAIWDAGPGTWGGLSEGKESLESASTKRKKNEWEVSLPAGEGELLRAVKVKVSLLPQCSKARLAVTWLT